MCDWDVFRLEKLANVKNAFFDNFDNTLPQCESASAFDSVCVCVSVECQRDFHLQK